MANASRALLSVVKMCRDLETVAFHELEEEAIDSNKY